MSVAPWAEQLTDLSTSVVVTVQATRAARQVRCSLLVFLENLPAFLTILFLGLCSWKPPTLSLRMTWSNCWRNHNHIVFSGVLPSVLGNEHGNSLFTVGWIHVVGLLYTLLLFLILSESDSVMKYYGLIRQALSQIAGNYWQKDIWHIWKTLLF